MSRAGIVTFESEPIALAVQTGVPVRITHGLGRQVAGYLVIWTDTPCAFSVQDPAADSSRDLVLVPSATASVRLVLL
jgi:hypothetical protein